VGVGESVVPPAAEYASRAPRSIVAPSHHHPPEVAHMSSPTAAGSVRQLLDLLDGICRLDGERLAIEDETALRGRGIRDLAWSATFSEDAATVEAARWFIWEASQSLRSPSASIHDLYMARGRGEVSGFTVPAVNLRTQVFDMAAAMCRAAQVIDAGTIVFELARSEQEYTFQ